MERYNPLAAGHVVEAGLINGRKLWKLTEKAKPIQDKVEVELMRLGYVRIQVGESWLWAYAGDWDGR